jgi:hypothetical protein
LELERWKLILQTASLPSSLMESRYAMTREWYITTDSDSTYSVDLSAQSSPDLRLVGKIILSNTNSYKSWFAQSYKLAAIKLMTASQEHLEKHC